MDSSKNLNLAAFVCALVATLCPLTSAHYAGGTGEPNNPYLIYTAGQLNAIGAEPNDWDKHFKLMTDIDLSAYDGKEGRPVFNIIGFTGLPPSRALAVAGQTAHGSFAGVFDGNGYAISNFTYANLDEDDAGFFRCVSDPNAEIKNLGLVDPNVSGDHRVGALVSVLGNGVLAGCYVDGGTIVGSGIVGGLVASNNGIVTDCHSTSLIVVGGDCVGGLVGRNAGTVAGSYAEGEVAGGDDVGGVVGKNARGGEISRCHAIVAVSGGDHVGGLVGYNDYYGTVTNSYASGTVSGYRYVGGLAGNNESFADVANCHASGTVTGESCVGGLVGRNWGDIMSCGADGSATGGYDVGGVVGLNERDITCCYADTSVTGAYDVGGLVGRSYGRITCCHAHGSATGEHDVGGLVGLSDAEITSCYANAVVAGQSDTGGLVGSSFDTVLLSFWDVQTSGQTTSAGGEGKTTAEMSDPNTFRAAGWNFVGLADGPDDFWATDPNEGYPLLCWQVSDAPLPAFSGGAGTSEEPYLLASAGDLNSIGSNPRLMDSYFLLTNDVDLAGVSFFRIGSEAVPFAGVLDGNGKTISNLRYSGWSAVPTGLISCMDGRNAEIRDLGLIDPNIDAGSGWYVGSLVGDLGDGKITRCYREGGIVAGGWRTGGLVGCSAGGTIASSHSAGAVHGRSDTGGLVGYNAWGTIEDSCSTGSVTGRGSVGGFIGYNRDAVANCCSTGFVTGTKSVGGFLGYQSWTGQIANCCSTGVVVGVEHVGGFLGYHDDPGDIINCYASAVVTGDTHVGGFIGSRCSSSKVFASFWDIELSGLSISAGGTGLTTAQMQDIDTFLDAGWDFIDEIENGTDDIWWILDGQDYPRLWWERAEGEF